MRFKNISYPNWYSSWTKQINFNKQQILVVETEGRLVFVSSANMYVTSRSKGPAEIHPTGRIVYKDIHGGLHRTDGPAVIHSSGSEEYWVNGSCITSDEFFFRYNKL